MVRDRSCRLHQLDELLKGLGLTEGRSTGIPKIFREMRQNGSPKPQFEFDEDHTYFQVRLPVHRKALKAGGEDGNATPEVATEVTPKVERVLLALTGEISSRQELQAALGLKDSEHVRNAYVSAAIQSGWVTIPYCVVK